MIQNASIKDTSHLNIEKLTFFCSSGRNVGQIVKKKKKLKYIYLTQILMWNLTSHFPLKVIF